MKGYIHHGVSKRRKVCGVDVGRGGGGRSGEAFIIGFLESIVNVTAVHLLSHWLGPFLHTS
jgi:hypothetical protein